MPLYEYQCDACGFRFEVIQRFSDPPVENCQSCGGPVRKLLSSPAIQFKGTGWYVTDYARKGAKGAGSDRDSAEKKPKADEGTAKSESAAKPSASSSAKD